MMGPYACLYIIIFVVFSSSSEIFLKLDTECNSDCECSKDVYKPVCGVDGVMYYSPCHAGCKDEKKGDKKVSSLMSK